MSSDNRYCSACGAVYSAQAIWGKLSTYTHKCCKGKCSRCARMAAVTMRDCLERYPNLGAAQHRAFYGMERKPFHSKQQPPLTLQIKLQDDEWCRLLAQVYRNGVRMSTKVKQLRAWLEYDRKMAPVWKFTAVMQGERR
jgi:hypothetical protein